MNTLAELLAELVASLCHRCRGLSVPGRQLGQPGYCSVCDGKGTVITNRYALLTDAERVTVLEREVVSLREQKGVMS